MVTRLAADLHREFPDQRGWSRRNLLYMRKAAEVWPTEPEFVHHVGARLPWRHVTVLLDRFESREERDWYAAAAAESGWTRGVLEVQIRSGLRTAMGAAPTNFTTALDSPDSELAQQLVKDPYVFEHLGLVMSLAERDVEQALMDRLQDTMLQLGRGMAFIGRQVRLSVPDDRSDQVDEFYVDLLFFNVEQLRYVVVELKVGKFEPAHIGQLGTRSRPLPSGSAACANHPPPSAAPTSPPPDPSSAAADVTTSLSGWTGACVCPDWRP